MDAKIHASEGRKNRSRDDKIAQVFKTCVDLNKGKTAMGGIVISQNDRNISQK